MLLYWHIVTLHRGPGLDLDTHLCSQNHSTQEGDPSQEEGLRSYANKSRLSQWSLEIPDQALVESLGLINRVFKAAQTDRALQNHITSIYFTASLPVGEVQLQEVQIPETVAGIYPTCVIVCVSSKLNSQLKFESPAHKQTNSRKAGHRKSSQQNPVLADIPAVCQPWTIAHLWRSKGLKARQPPQVATSV